MTTAFLSEIVGQPGLFQMFELMDEWGVIFPRNEVIQAMDGLDIQDPDIVYEQLTENGILTQMGNATDVSLTTKGRQTRLLLQAINGSDIQEVFQRITALYPSWSRYQVVRDRMTQDFIRELYERPDFRRIYLCSRWINLEKRPRGRLTQAIHSASEHGEVEMLVVHGPLTRDSHGNPQGNETLNFLKNLGAEIVLNERVHAKLYIREPGPAGGPQVAVVGSENLTVPKYAELGLKITNDGEMIRRLIEVFFDIYGKASRSY